jgi:translation initiation factor IF-2
MVQERQTQASSKRQVTRPLVSLEDFFKQRGESGDQTLNLILKADVQGSVEPIVNSLKQLGDEKLKVKFF